MSDSEETLKNGKRYWLLDPSIPDITFPSAQTIRQVNMSFNTLDLSLAIPNIGDESRTDISAYWVKGNGLKV